MGQFYESGGIRLSYGFALENDERGNRQHRSSSVFFYESMWCLLGFVLLHFYGKYKQKYSGQIFFMYLVWYGFERTVVEGLRTDSLYLPFQIFGADIRVSQVLSTVIFITGIVFLIINRKRRILSMQIIDGKRYRHR